jgi:hypothetical protein
MTPMSARQFRYIDLLSTEVSFGGNLLGTSNHSQRLGRARRKAIHPRPR